MEKTVVVNLGSVEQIPRGLGKSFVIQEEEIAVFRGRDGKLFAIQNICPHKKTPLADGLMGANRVICPGHGHKFNLVTGQGSEEGESVKVYPVQEVNGEILLGYAFEKAR